MYRFKNFGRISLFLSTQFSNNLFIACQNLLYFHFWCWTSSLLLRTRSLITRYCFHSLLLLFDLLLFVYFSLLFFLNASQIKCTQMLRYFKFQIYLIVIFNIHKQNWRLLLISSQISKSTSSDKSIELSYHKC